MWSRPSPKSCPQEGNEGVVNQVFKKNLKKTTRVVEKLKD